MRGTALVILAAALTLTACGGSTSEPPATTALTAPPASAATAAPTTATNDIPDCAPGDLALSLGQQDGAAGTLYTPVIFTNTAQYPCSLSGYPRVSLAAGTPPTPLGPEAEPDPTLVAPTPVTLQPAATAFATIRYTQAGNFECDRTPAQYLLITPPGHPTPTPLPFTVDACTKPAYLLLHLDYIKPGPAS